MHFSFYVPTLDADFNIVLIHLQGVITLMASTIEPFLEEITFPQSDLYMWQSYLL